MCLLFISVIIKLLFHLIIRFRLHRWAKLALQSLIFFGRRFIPVRIQDCPFQAHTYMICSKFIWRSYILSKFFRNFVKEFWMEIDTLRQKRIFILTIRELELVMPIWVIGVNVSYNKLKVLHGTIFAPNQMNQISW